MCGAHGITSTLHRMCKHNKLSWANVEGSTPDIYTVYILQCLIVNTNMSVSVSTFQAEE